MHLIILSFIMHRLITKQLYADLQDHLSRSNFFSNSLLLLKENWMKNKDENHARWPRTRASDVRHAAETGRCRWRGNAKSEGAGRTSRRIRHCLCSNPENARRAAQSGNGPAVTATSATFMDGLCASMCAPGKTASKQSWLQDSFQVEYHGDPPFLFQEKVTRRKHFVWPQEKKR
jgi:hypothetical protein